MLKTESFSQLHTYRERGGRRKREREMGKRKRESDFVTLVPELYTQDKIQCIHIVLIAKR